MTQCGFSNQHDGPPTHFGRILLFLASHVGEARILSLLEALIPIIHDALPPLCGLLAH